ncbi:DUF4190 domain-containing protein [Nocardia puris]|uniref:DUF4190 domain-containing protein n=1 Tax=Nocardia puris TaxID=208602 RepID=A0A366DDS2_9NOCA|nr:DUF4190 domain-containing protein [Nocardia puris]MBF6214545.1 DUF4190 domain-containing protein [Nocardia puris]MBF6365954.1 DUF4190 domain-containing protein [Nocardia puris]MBF6460403.1 DUF4190 domain-containing protein [Nocardia puris]RBO87398.1 hypothetical protein DFR74_111104 [Nocardia puris]
MVIPNQPVGSPVEHPHANAVLALGAASIFCCGALGPVAWAMGKRAVDQIEDSNGAVGGRVQVMVGMTLGIIGTVLMVLIAILFLFVMVGGRA